MEGTARGDVLGLQRKMGGKRMVGKDWREKKGMGIGGRGNGS